VSRSFFALLVVLLCFPRVAHALPTFARKYETSCQTCHVAYPKLTPFGEAFRWNGYRFPDHGDDTAQKRDPVELGNDAQKERWPKAVFPGSIPWDAPVSLVLSGAAGYGPEFETHHHGTVMAGMEESEEEHGHEPQLDLSTMVDMFGVRTGGTLGDHVSFLGAVNLGGMALVEIERANVVFSPFARPTDLRIKVGIFEPELHGVTIHRGLFGHMLRLTTTPYGDSPWTPEMSQSGLELSGIAAHRFGWAAGVVEHETPGVYLAKDVYGRAFVKLGGMPADGTGGTSATAAWRDRSFTLGASVYNGRAQISTDTSLQDDPFTRVGVDGHAMFDDLSLDVVAAREWHDSPYAGDSTDGSMDKLYAELTWVALPVVFPSVRVEASRTTDGTADPSEATWLAVGAVTGVVRPNVLLRGTVGVGAEPGEEPGFHFATLAYSIAY